MNTLHLVTGDDNTSDVTGVTDANPAEQADEQVEFGDDYSGPDPLFVGDTGQLPLDVRNTFVTLLKKRYISADRHPREWQIVLANEPALRTRFNDMFLDLIIDRSYEVAYKRQAQPEGGHRFPTVLHDLAYGREETILLVHLRRLIRSSQKAGDDAVFVDRADLIHEIGTYRPSHTTNHVASDKAADNAVASMVKADLLLKTAEKDRYRISSIIEVLLPVDRIKDLHDWLQSQNTGEAGGDAEFDEMATLSDTDTDINDIGADNEDADDGTAEGGEH